MTNPGTGRVDGYCQRVIDNCKEQLAREIQQSCHHWNGPTVARIMPWRPWDTRLIVFSASGHDVLTPLCAETLGEGTGDVAYPRPSRYIESCCMMRLTRYCRIMHNRDVSPARLMWRSSV